MKNPGPYAVFQMPVGAPYVINLALIAEHLPHAITRAATIADAERARRLENPDTCPAATPTLDPETPHVTVDQIAAICAFFSEHTERTV